MLSHSSYQTSISGSCTSITQTVSPEIKQESVDLALVIESNGSLSQSPRSTLPSSSGHAHIVSNSLPFRAKRATQEMKLMMSVFRLDPFALRGAIWQEARPLDQEPEIIRWQLDPEIHFLESRQTLEAWQSLDADHDNAVANLKSHLSSLHRFSPELSDDDDPCLHYPSEGTDDDEAMLEEQVEDYRLYYAHCPDDGDSSATSSPQDYYPPQGPPATGGPYADDSALSSPTTPYQFPSYYPSYTPASSRVDPPYRSTTLTAARFYDTEPHRVYTNDSFSSPVSATVSPGPLLGVENIQSHQWPTEPPHSNSHLSSFSSTYNPFTKSYYDVTQLAMNSTDRRWSLPANHLAAGYTPSMSQSQSTFLF